MEVPNKLLKRKSKEPTTYIQGPIMGNKNEFEKWKREVQAGKCEGSFIVLPETINENITIFYSDELKVDDSILKEIEEFLD